MTRGRLGRRPELNGLRGLAVLAVVGAHLETRYGSGGMVGVDVFFVLSGFLITTLLIEERERTGRTSFGGFFKRRAARLLPALAVFLAASAALVGVTGVDRSITLRALPAVIGYAGNWWIVSGHSNGALGHTWSLAVEEQFYLVWPVLVVLASRVSRRLVGLVATAGIVFALWQRTTACASGAYCVVRVYHSTDTRMDQLLIGALLAVAFTAGALERVPRWVGELAGWPAAISLAIFAAWPVDWASHSYDTWGMSATAGAAACVIAAVLVNPRGPLSRALAVRPLAAVGTISYSVYLWNALLLVLLRDGTSLSSSWRAPVIIGGSLAIAAASWRLVEAPIMRRASAGRQLRGEASVLEVLDPELQWVGSRCANSVVHGVGGFVAEPNGHVPA